MVIEKNKMSDNKFKYPILESEALDALFRNQEGWHTIQTGPPVKFNHSKQEMIADVIADLIDSGLDEDAHFRNIFITSDMVKPSDFLNVVTDVDKLDALMSMARDHVIVTLKKVANDLEKEELKKITKDKRWCNSP